MAAPVLEIMDSSSKIHLIYTISKNWNRREVCCGAFILILSFPDKTSRHGIVTTFVIVYICITYILLTQVHNVHIKWQYY
jgi:hypothetical protein